MHVIVAGGGTVGERVAQAVHAAGNTAAIVEENPARAAELASRGLQVVTGNACAPGRLEAVGALHADVLVACTGRDEDNLIISVMARRRFEIPGSSPRSGTTPTAGCSTPPGAWTPPSPPRPPWSP
jgi:trk system potassium uptake protein